MQDDSGLKSLMSVSWVYEQFQNVVGAKRLRRWMAQTCWQLKGGEKIVDIGCGPGVILEHLPKDVRYVGFDLSEEYITTARKKYGARGAFLVGTAEHFRKVPSDQLKSADLVLCNGLLHHLEDSEAIHVLRLAKEILAPTGKLFCIEPAFLIHQGKLSKWIMGRDRGRNVRSEEGWKNLTRQVFGSYSTHIATNLLRLPYVHIIIECRKND